MPYIIEAAGEPYQKILGLIKQKKHLRGLYYVLNYVIADDLGTDVYKPNTSDEAINWIEKNKDKLNVYRPYSKYIEWMSKFADKRMNANFQGRVNLGCEWLRTNLKDLPKILSGENISTFTIDDAIEKIKKSKEDESAKRSMEDPIVFTLPNGNTLRRLTKLQQIRDEGNVMRNCCGDESKAYDYYAEENGFDPTATKDGIYALRSPNGKRLATIEIKNGKIAQQLGKANTRLDDDTKNQIKEALEGAEILPNFSLMLKSGKIKKEDLKNYNLYEANLQGVDLQGVDLQEVDLRGADLRGANLERVRLQGAFLRGAHLEGAHLEEAHLEKANLEEAHLEGIHLEGAHLERANLYGVHLEEAHLEGAHLERTYLCRAHLQGAFLQGAHLESAYLDGANLEGANLEAVRYDFVTRWPKGFTPPSSAVNVTASLFDVVAQRIEATYAVTAALDKRLAGVMRQYGPEVAFLTGEVLTTDRYGRTSAYLSNEEIRWEQDENDPDGPGRRLETPRIETPLQRIKTDMKRLGTTLEAWLSEAFSTGKWYNDGSINVDSDVDALAPWVARIVNQYVKGKEPIETLQLISKNAKSIAGWVAKEKPDLMGLTVKKVVYHARRWGAEKKRQDEADMAPKSKVVFRHGRFTFHALENASQIEYEGRVMKNCLKERRHQWPKEVQEGKIELYSCRDETGKSQAAIEVKLAEHDEFGLKHIAQQEGRGPDKKRIVDSEILEAIDEFAKHIGAMSQKEYRDTYTERVLERHRLRPPEELNRERQHRMELRNNPALRGLIREDDDDLPPADQEGA